MIRSTWATKEYFEGIREVQKEPAPGAKRLIAEIDYEIQVARFRVESSGGSRAEKSPGV